MEKLWFLNPDFLNIIVLIAGFIFSTFGIKKWIVDKVQGRKYEKALQLVYDSVTEVYHEFVQELKTASEDGKLTAIEKKRAMRMALDKLRSKGLETGIDVAKALGTAYLPSVIEMVISRVAKEAE
jgi:hypothetical protein